MNQVISTTNDLRAEQGKRNFDLAGGARSLPNEANWICEQIRRGEVDQPHSNLTDLEVEFIDLSLPLARQSRIRFWSTFSAGANRRHVFSSWEEAGAMLPSQLEVDDFRFSEPSLSDEFRTRLSRLLSLDAGWDGIGSLPITEETANWASEIARQMLVVTGEPKVSPASTGELLLVWKFDDGTEVEVFVDEGRGVPSVGVLARGDDIYEVPLSQLSDLTVLLRHRSIPQASTW